MNSFSQLMDPTVEERRNADLTKALIDGLLPMRADVDAFAAGVRARIDAPRSAEPMVLSPWLRAAASILPPVALPKALPASVGAAMATKASAKLLPTLVLLPIATMVAVALTLFAVLRLFLAPAINSEQRADRQLVQEELCQWWSELLGWKVACSIALAAGVFFFPVASFTLGFVTATIGLLVFYDRLARASLASPDEIARCARGVLMAIVIQLGALPILIRADGALFGTDTPVQHGVMLVAPLLTLAALWCHLSIRSRQPRDRVFLVSAGAAIFVMGISLTVPWPQPNIPESLEGLESAASHRPYPPTLEQVFVVDAAARLAGHPGLSRDGLADRAAELAAEDSDDSLLAALQLGLVDDATQKSWREGRRRSPYQVEMLRDHPLLARSPGLLLHVLLRADELRADAVLRAAYASAIVDAYSQPDRFDNVVDLVQAVSALDSIGADASPLRVRAHELLLACTTRDVKHACVGFALFRPHMEDAGAGGVHATAIAGAAAVVLMGKFGAPEGLDLREVDRGFARQLPWRIDSERFAALAAFAGRSALQKLDAFVAEEPSALGAIAHWQVFAGALVLAFGAIAVTTRARRNE
jgi:hypothetical protein